MEGLIAGFLQYLKLLTSKYNTQHIDSEKKQEPILIEAPAYSQLVEGNFTSLIF